jgi:type IV secretory pathway VirB2 component (pilin)
VKSITFPRVELTRKFLTMCFSSLRLRRSLVVGLTGLMFGPLAMASSTSGYMPWDAPIDAIRADITGPFASAAATLALMGAGYGLLFRSEEMSGWIKTLLGVVLAIALTIAGQNIISLFQASGALVG